MTDDAAAPGTGTQEIWRPATVTIGFAPHRIVLLVAASAAAIWILGVAREAFALGSEGWTLVALDGERNVPAWFSSLLLFVGALSCIAAALLSRATAAPGTLGWAALAAIFGLMSADELLSLHESTMPFMATLGQWQGPFTWSWVVWALPLIAIVAAAFVPFLLAVRRPTALRLLLAGAVYVGGALGMEMVGGIVASTPQLGIPYAVPFSIEEGLELTGALLFLRAVLLHIAETTPCVVLETAGRRR